MFAQASKEKMRGVYQGGREAFRSSVASLKADSEDAPSLAEDMDGLEEREMSPPPPPLPREGRQRSLSSRSLRSR